MGQAQRARETDDPGRLLARPVRAYQSSPSTRDNMWNWGRRGPSEGDPDLIVHTTAITTPILACVEGALLLPPSHHPIKLHPRGTAGRIKGSGAGEIFGVHT